MSNFDVNNLFKRYTALEVSPEFDPYSRVDIVVDENTTYSAGTDTGRILTINNPWGTKEQAEKILEAIKGYQYQPFTATGALLNPAAELGDGVNMDGTYSGIFRISREYGRLMKSDIEAPADEEIDHEYPYESSESRTIERKFSAVNSTLEMQSTQISAKVSQTGGDGSSFSWALVKDSFTLFANGAEVFRADKDGAKVTGVITATSGKIGKFNIGDAIWNEIDNFANSNGKSKGVYLGSDGIRLGKNFSVDDSGNVNANNMKLTGTLNVGGTDITAENLRSGAQSAVDNGGYWSGGAGGGYNFINSASEGGSYYSPFFRATQISCDSIGGSTATFSKLVARDSFYLGSVTPLKLISKASASFVVGY